MNRKKILERLLFFLGICFVAFTAVTSLGMLFGFGLGLCYASFCLWVYKLYNNSLK